MDAPGATARWLAQHQSSGPVLGDHESPGVDVELFHAAADSLTERIGSDLRAEADGHTQPRKGDADVELGSDDIYPKSARGR